MKNGPIHSEPFAIVLSAGGVGVGGLYDVTFNDWQATREHRTYRRNGRRAADLWRREKGKRKTSYGVRPFDHLDYVLLSAR